MNSVSKALVVGLITFGASLLGMLAQGLVAPDVLAASKPAVGAMAGLIGLLLALVLGLLVWTSFAVFTGQQSEAFSLGPIIAEIDLLLEQCGPAAKGGRAGLRAALHNSRKRFFENDATGPQLLTIAEIKTTRAGVNAYFDSVAPADEAQGRLIQTARGLALKFQDTQIAMLVRLASPFPPRVVDIVVFWAAILFLGDGLAASPNAVTIAAHFIGAVGISSALFLILELSTPYTGYIRLSPLGLDRILQALGEPN